MSSKGRPRPDGPPCSRVVFALMGTMEYQQVLVYTVVPKPLPMASRRKINSAQELVVKLWKRSEWYKFTVRGILGQRHCYFMTYFSLSVVTSYFIFSFYCNRNWQNVSLSDNPSIGLGTIIYSGYLINFAPASFPVYLLQQLKIWALSHHFQFCGGN